MRLIGQQFDSAIIKKIEGVLENNPSISRRALSLQVCEWLNWKAPNGKPREVNCRKALLELDRRGVIRLPAPQEFCFNKTHSEHPANEFLRKVEIQCTLAELGEVKIIPVSSRYSKASKIWNELMDQFHYLGKGPLCGSQIRYLVENSQHSYIGALAFSAAQWRLKKRDEYIGWTEAARRANLNRIVCNSRFLILPDVHVPNLASHTLGLCMKRITDDWRERYSYEPVLVETFVNPELFTGTCYTAANWVKIGKTAARATAYPNGKITDGPKDIYVYPLAKNWKESLCTEPQVALCSMPPIDAPAGWIEQEFGRVQFFDERLKSRLYTLAGDFFAQPGELIPQACNGSKAKTKAAYRFFENPNVNLQVLLRPHIESSIERVRAHSVILAVQDTTTLNYTMHPPEGVGPIQTTQTTAVGLVLHDTMAFTTEGTPLGLLNVQFWARDPQEMGKSIHRHDIPIEEKESMKWLTSYRAVAEAQKLCPETMIVSVGDREADLFDLFHEATKDPSGPKLLIRAERTRYRKVEEEGLWEKMKSQPEAGSIEVNVPRRSSRPPRVAKLQLYFDQVTLTPPTRSSLPPQNLWAVYARETGCGENIKEPIDWMLLTTIKTESFEDACQRLSWYARRWGIEVYHRTIKSGCRIEDRRLDDATSLESCLAIDLVVAWRVYWLTMIGREKPDTPCDQILSRDEWIVLGIWATGKVLDAAPSTQQAARWIGQMGGWLSRNKSDNPGTTCMWRGLIRLPNMTLGYRLALETHGIRDGP